MGTWDESNEKTQKFIGKIEAILEKKQPKNISDVIKAVLTIDRNCGTLPNPNSKGQYCQLLLYPSKKEFGFSESSMSISKYNLYN